MRTVANIRTDGYAGPASAPSACEAAFFADEPECVFASTAGSRRWVIGAFISICLGTAGAISVYCVWQVWNIILYAS
jgi:hypothetical protein